MCTLSCFAKCLPKLINTSFTSGLINTSFTSANYHIFLCVFVRVRKITLLSQQFQVCNTVVLAIVTMMYIKSLQFPHLSLKPHLLILTTSQPQATTILLCFYEFSILRICINQVLHLLSFSV